MFLDAFLSVARGYASATGLEMRTISSRVFDDGKVLPGVDAGQRTISLARADAAMRWFSANWPEGAEWPAGVSRPEAGDEKDAA